MTKDTDPAIGAESKVQLGFLITLIVCAIPLVASYMAVRQELSGIRSDLQQIRQNMGDLWSGSMMILWADRLRYENTGKMTVPDVNKVREEMPMPQTGS